MAAVTRLDHRIAFVYKQLLAARRDGNATDIAIRLRRLDELLDMKLRDECPTPQPREQPA